MRNLSRIVLSAILTSLLAVVAVGSAVAQQADGFSTRAQRVMMIDADTGAVLYSKDPDARFPPASLAKLMTMEVVFAALKAGEVSGFNHYKVSEHAWRTGGAPSRTATMFAALNSTIALNDLMQGAIVIFANDACIVIAEGMSGSEAAFAEKMNARAGELGLSASRFVNPTGLPGEGQSTSVRDMARLARHIWRSYPDRFGLYSQPEFAWNKITQQNRNPLLKLGIGADGFVAGFAEEAGYGIVATAARGDRRLILAASGLENEKHRLEETRALIDWGMTAFRKIDIFDAGEIVGEASVFGGDRGRVKLAAMEPVSLLIPSTGEHDIRARIVYQGPVVAPVKAGDPIGRLVVTSAGSPIQEAPLFAAEAVETGGLLQRALGGVYELSFGWLR